MFIRQIELVSGVTHTITWVPDSINLKKGSIYKLKNDPTEWNIHWISEMSLENSEINRGWKVGGL